MKPNKLKEEIDEDDGYRSLIDVETGERVYFKDLKFDVEDMLDFAQDQQNSDIYPTLVSLFDWLTYR